MKKFLLIVSAAALTFAVACKKKEKNPVDNTPKYTVDPYQNAAIFYFGGTWCGPCGYYGKPAKETLHNNNPKLTIVSAQLNGAGGSVDPFNNASSNSFASFFGVSSLPTMYTGGAAQPMPAWIGNYIVASTVQTAVDGFRAKEPIVNAKMTFSKINDAVTAAVTFEFYKETTDEYYYNVIATESSLAATQTSDNSANKNVHDNVIRAMGFSNVQGDLLSTGSTVKKVVTKDVTITLDPKWKKENIHYHVIIWQKNLSTNKFSLANAATAKIQ